MVPIEEIMECIICDLFKEYSRKGEGESNTSEDGFKASANKIILRIRDFLSHFALSAADISE